MEIKPASSGLPLAAAVGAVVVMMITTLWRAFGGPAALSAVLFAAAAVLIAVEYRNIPPRLRTTSLLLLATSVVLLPFTQSPLAAVQRGIFVSGLLLALMASVMLLARCALRSRHVQIVGTNLRGQPTGQRYLSFNIAGQVFSGMLGLAGANIMLVMAAPPDEGKSPTRTATVIAVTRGFAAAGFWSPVFGNMAILLALYPSLHWIEVFPVGAGLAQITIVVGVLVNRFSRKTLPTAEPQPAADTVPDVPPPLASAAIPVLLIMFGFLGTVLATSSLLKIGITASIVLVGPVVALLLNIVLADPGRRIPDALQRMGEGATLQFPRLASEAILFTAAGCAGSIMADAFPRPWVEQVGLLLGGMPFFGIAFLMASIMGIALAGIHPVLTAVFMASTMTPQVLNLPPLVHISAILTGWGLSACLTPYSVLSLTASRYAGVGLYQISLGKNWAFALFNALVASVLLTVLAMLL